MLDFNQGRGQGYTWLSAFFVILLIFSGFLVQKEPPNTLSGTALSPRTDPSVSDLTKTHHHSQHHEHPQSSNHSTFVRRADFSCGKGRPCANGACCGQSGFCGYGPTYCGTGCISNCKSHAECGKYSEPANQKCPLNTCCSKFGFCGTTKVSSISLPRGILGARN